MSKEENPLASLKDLVEGKEPEELEEDEVEVDEEQMNLLMDNIALMGGGDLFIMQAIIKNADAIVCEQIREAFINSGSPEEGEEGEAPA